MGERSALVEAVREAMEDAPPLQSALFPAAELASLPEGPARAPALRKRGPGRPEGAINRKTAVLRERIFAWGGGEHPLRGLVEVYSRPVQDLAAELGCALVKAMELQIECRRACAEYVDGKMPVSVNISGAGVIPVIFEGFGQAMGATIDGEFFQPLSSDDTQKLDEGKLEDDR